MIYTIAAISTIIIVELLIRYKVFVSAPNSRSLHNDVVPTSSGIALGFVICIYYLQFSVEMAAIAFFICLLGALDDRFQISQLTRLVAQILIATIIIKYNYTWLFTSFESLFLIFIFVYFINSYNFMDGIDLLGISQAIFILLSMLLIELIIYPNLLITDVTLKLYPTEIIKLMLISLMIIGYYNKTPAKIFLGSSGSYLLGLFIAIMLLDSTTTVANLVSTNYISINYFTPLILYTVFLVDTLYVLIKKLATSEDSGLSYKEWIIQKIKKLTTPHKTHNYQKMVALGMSHQKVVTLLMIYNIFWCLPLAITSVYYQDLASFCLVLSCLPYIIVCNKNKAGVI